MSLLQPDRPPDWRGRNNNIVGASIIEEGASSSGEECDELINNNGRVEGRKRRDRVVSKALSYIQAQ
ncbi:Hypothetical protein FKW44_013831 [Caligus rogercresseyi]|uniref:Uncharacterized protein n=1 Tax=Caligus rogercresseyi TaxID=217165 RepID=A0A7T8GYS5_CALRO|nr:Hypothetical protein FKW44_013831 [Caligus rogercresseyi]